MAGSASWRWVDSLQGQYLYMLVSLLALLAIYPFVDLDSRLGWLLSAAYAATILLSLVVCLGRRTGLVVLALGVSSQALISGGIFHLDSVVGNFLRATAMFVITAAILRGVLRPRIVTLNAVYGACSVYLLMAIAWSRLYLAIDSIVPGSFNFSAGGNALDMEGMLIYFSFITMTTVGYGDLAPVGDQARMMAALQGVTGQLYIAVVVARIVALEISNRQDRQPS